MKAPSIMSVNDESCEKVKNVDRLLPGKSAFKHHVEGITRSSSLQSRTGNDILVDEASWTVICRDRVHFSDDRNRFMSSCLNQMYFFCCAARWKAKEKYLQPQWMRINSGQFSFLSGNRTDYPFRSGLYSISTKMRHIKLPGQLVLFLDLPVVEKLV